MDGKVPDTSSWCRCCYGNVSRAGHCSPCNFWLGVCHQLPASHSSHQWSLCWTRDLGLQWGTGKQLPSVYFLCLSALAFPAIELKAKMRQSFGRRWFCFCLHKVNMYPSKQISPPFNLSFFCRLNSHGIFSPIFFFFYSQENMFALPPPQCLFHSHSCHRDLYKVLTPLQAQNLSCCRSNLLHTPVWDTVLHKSLNKSVWGGFFPRN